MTAERDPKTGRFVVGNSGNPNGRPPAAFSFTEMLRARVAERPRLVDKLVELAESEDENVSYKALAYIANRLDGMPRQATEITGADGGPVELTWSDGRPA